MGAIVFPPQSPGDEILEDMLESDRLPNNVMKVPQVY